jgi:hypothetical protein
MTRPGLGKWIPDDPGLILTFCDSYLAPIEIVTLGCVLESCDDAWNEKTGC